MNPPLCHSGASQGQVLGKLIMSVSLAPRHENPKSATFGVGGPRSLLKMSTFSGLMSPWTMSACHLSQRGE